MTRSIEVTDKYINTTVKKLGFNKAMIQLDLELRTGFIRYKPSRKENYYIDSEDWNEVTHGSYKEIPRYFKGS
jgi:hypothetical protein